MSSTIFALSSGSVPSGVAVVRISGRECFAGLEKLGLCNLQPRKMELRQIVSPDDGELIDTGLVCSFPGPSSFTGEDCAELHVHGGRAVVSKLLETLSTLDDYRFAEAGEFSRRAFENGKLDLTEVEGLGDLISADTEFQRKQAIAQSGGAFRTKLESWREEIIRCRAYLEAEFDFSDEEDVPDTMRDYIEDHVRSLCVEIKDHLSDGRKGEIVRQGLRVVLTGPPNSGKSSLMNALAGRDIAIVSSQAGTTRDVLECSIDLGGYLVTVVDTAGIRESDDEVESEGIKRALSQSELADLTIWLSSSVAPTEPDAKMQNAITVVSKDDLNDVDEDLLSLNTVTEGGLDQFLGIIQNHLKSLTTNDNAVLVTRERHRFELNNCLNSLQRSLDLVESNPVLCGEELRISGECLGRLTGFIDVEDLLDVIFSEFCVGK